jgi:hypothetical protein
MSMSDRPNRPGLDPDFRIGKDWFETFDMPAAVTMQARISAPNESAHS